MLGNSAVFVTCKCLDRIRTPWRGRTTRNRRHVTRIPPEWKSLGDFQVGTPIEQLLEAYDRHLRTE